VTTSQSDKTPIVEESPAARTDERTSRAPKKKKKKKKKKKSRSTAKHRCYFLPKLTKTNKTFPLAFGCLSPSHKLQGVSFPSALLLGQRREQHPNCSILMAFRFLFDPFLFAGQTSAPDSTAKDNNTLGASRV